MRTLSQALFAAGVIALPLDVVLRFRILGYNARLSHLLLGSFFLVVLAQAVRSSSWRTIRVPRPAVVFLVAVAASVPASLDRTKSIGYAAWAAFDVAVFLVGIPLFLRLAPSRAASAPGPDGPADADQAPPLGTWAAKVHLLAAVAACEVAFGEIAALFGGGPRPASSFIGAVAFPRLQGLTYEPAYLAFFLVPPLALALTWRLVGVDERRRQHAREREAASGDARRPRQGWSARSLRVVAILAGATILLGTARSGWIALAAAYVAAAVTAAVIAERDARRAGAGNARGAHTGPRDPAHGEQHPEAGDTGVHARRHGVGPIAREAALLAATSALVAAAIFAGFTVAKSEGGVGERAGAVFDLQRHLASFGAARGTGNDVALRTSWYALGIRVWADHPLFGVGIGGFGSYAVHQGYTPAIADPSKIVVPNVWVELLAETGVVGAAAMLLLVLSAGVGALRAGRTSAVAAGYGVAILVLGLVSFQFNSTVTRLDLWFPLGMASALASYSALPGGMRSVAAAPDPDAMGA